MTRRRRTTRRPAPGRGAATRRKPLNSYTPPEHDPLSDSRLRPLVERYAALAGASLDEVGPHVVEMEVPEDDRMFFGGRERILLAFAVGAIDHAPDTEMAVVGSPFVDQLLAAIRARGARLSLGLVGPNSFDEDTPPLDVPVRNATVGAPTIRVARHPVGRLLARVLIRAGASVEEHLVESKFFDLATGTPLPRDAAEVCEVVASQLSSRRGEQGERVSGSTVSGRSPERMSKSPRVLRARGMKLSASKPTGELVRLMVGDLQARLASRVGRLRAESERALAAELERTDAYYRELLESVGAKESDGIAMADAGRAIQAEHARRRLEEERRHQMHVVVYPLQMIEMEMVVQRGEWKLTASDGRDATIGARRAVSGTGGWNLICPTCGCPPSELVVCRDGAVACDSCAHDCTTCGQALDGDGGTGACESCRQSTDRDQLA